VNDALQVASAEWRALDVLRWQELSVDLSGLETESEALRRLSDTMSNAVAAAEGRLVAARVVIAGATALHGSLHRDSQHWRAQILASAQDQGEEALWLERIKIATTPVYEVAQLSARDALTKTVVDNLAEAQSRRPELPAEIGEMFDVLPPEIRAEIDAEWAGDQSASVLNDVRAIILDALGTKGGETA
jgi:hypothetical protein